MKISNAIRFAIVFGYVFLYSGSLYFQTNGMDHLNLIKNGLLIIILIMLYVQNRHENVILPWNLKTFFIIMIPLFLLEHACGIASDSLNPIIGFCTLFLISKYADRQFIKYLLSSIVIVSAISCMPMIYWYIKLGYYARTTIIFEKALLTFFFGISYVTLLLYIPQTKGVTNIALIAILVVALLVNFFILQSKTSIFVFLVVFVIMSFNALKNIGEIIRKYWWQIALSVLILSFLPINWQIPDAIKQATNKFTGKEVFETRSSMKTETYDVRRKILYHTIKVVDENPLIGAGFGNQKDSLRDSGTRASEAESQILDILLDGGLTYLIAFLILILPMMVSSGRYIFKNKYNDNDLFLFYQTLGFVILCIGNEMLTSLGWMFLGVLVYVYANNKTIEETFDIRQFKEIE